MRLSFLTKAVLALTLFAALLSFAKFDHCYNTNWSGVGVDSHECYSDLPALFDARGLVHHVWPYSSSTNSVEYPPLTGVVMWATALVTPEGIYSDKYYFLINVALLAFLFIAIAFVVSKINPKKWYLLPLLPAVIASLYIIWDLWAVLSAVASIYWFDRKRYGLSAVVLAISIATKFFPIVLLIPMALIFIRQGEIRRGVRYIAQTLLLWIVINLPFALTTPTGWWRFFKLNSSRPADLGSIWQALNIFKVNPPAINFLWSALFIITSLAVFAFLLRRAVTPKLAEIAFIFVALFTAFNKVYSPQYVLWLAPLGVIALVNNRDRWAFWVWQASEGIYHFAIWEYLASFAGAKFSLPARWYAAAIFLRVGASLIFALKLLLSTPIPAPPEEEFLLSDVVD